MSYFTHNYYKVDCECLTFIMPILPKDSLQTESNSERNLPPSKERKRNATRFQTNANERKNEQHYQRKRQVCLSHLHKCRIHWRC